MLYVGSREKGDELGVSVPICEQAKGTLFVVHAQNNRPTLSSTNNKQTNKQTNKAKLRFLKPTKPRVLWETLIIVESIEVCSKSNPTAQRTFGLALSGPW